MLLKPATPTHPFSLKPPAISPICSRVVNRPGGAGSPTKKSQTPLAYTVLNQVVIAEVEPVACKR